MKSSFPLTPKSNDVGNQSGSVDIDLSLPECHYTTMILTGDVVFTFSNPPPNGKEISFIIDITQDKIGKHAVIWPSNVRINPIIGSVPDIRTIVNGSTGDGGRNYDVLNILRQIKKWWQFWK